MLKHKNDFDSPKTPVRRKNSTVSIMSLPVSVNSSDSGTGTIRGTHGTIQGGAKSDKSAVSNLSLPVSVISVDSGTRTIRGAHCTPIKGAKSNTLLTLLRIPFFGRIGTISYVLPIRQNIDILNRDIRVLFYSIAVLSL